jgi:hypothetical protein
MLRPAVACNRYIIDRQIHLSKYENKAAMEMSVTRMPCMHAQVPPPGRSDTRRKVRLCFYEPRGANEHWLNTLVAVTGKHYVSHVEILFEDDMAASIFADDVVFFKKRSYSNPYYRIKMILVSSQSYDLMYDFAKRCAERQIGFSNAKMFCGPILGYVGSSDSTFCSEFVTHTLQVGGVAFAMKMNARRSTPSALLNHMISHETVCFDSTSFKMGLAFG